MSFPPFDSSAPSHTPPTARPGFPQPVYGYDQPAFGHMGYTDMSQSGRYTPMQMQYPPESSGLRSGQYPESYVPPSFSPTSAQFASQPYGTPPTNSDAMTYAPTRRRHQSTSAVLPSDSRYPMPRHPSGEGMPVVQEHEFGLPQVPSQPFYDPNAPASRQAAPARSSNAGQSLTTSALALEKPYVCDICQTRFARHHDCRRHRETHVVNASGEKPHHCVVCGKSFTRKDALKRHTNQKGCDINAAASNNVSMRSSRSSSSSSPQQVPGTFYPVSNLPHSSSSANQQYY